MMRCLGGWGLCCPCKGRLAGAGALPGRGTLPGVGTGSLEGVLDFSSFGGRVGGGEPEAGLGSEVTLAPLAGVGPLAIVGGPALVGLGPPVFRSMLGPYWWLHSIYNSRK